MPTVIDVEELPASVGAHLGFSEWRSVTQDQVDRFADATGSYQWIHEGTERARAGPFGGPIAHGYLTLSLIPVLLEELLVVQGITMGINYGANRVRFPAPVPIGSDLRMGATLAEVKEVAGGVQVTLDTVFEVKDTPKPPCVAQVVFRYYR